MKIDNANSGSTSGATSATGPGNPATSSGHAPSEAEFLRQQADQARAAIGTVFSEIKQKLGNGANPVEWAREHPLISMGVAVVAGFVGATALVPSKEEQAMARLAALERALHPNTAEPGKTAYDGHSDAGGRSISSMIVREVVGLIRPLAVSLVSGMLGAKAGEAEARSDTATSPEPVSTNAAGR